MPETHTTRRLKWLLVILLVWVGVIFARLFSLQVLQHDDLLRLAQQQQQKMITIPALRGAILDRTGQPLAKTLPAESILVNPLKIPDPGVAADLLSRLLGLDRAKVYDQIATAKRRGGGFLWIKRKADQDEAERVRSLKLDWVEFRPEMRRYYPHGELASHVVGSTWVADDETDRGNAGIELEFDDELAGRPGSAREYIDVKQNAYDSVVARKPEPGSTITLSIDPNMQYVAEKELDKSIASSGAKTGSIVALNPYTGEVLAMANYPRFDPNVPPSSKEPPNARSNIAISTPFEPGSVQKVITLSAALETTRLGPTSLVNCLNGVIHLKGRVIHDEHRYSILSMADVLAKSSNIGAIQIGLQVGDSNLYKFERKFGFGRKTDIDLPGESAGLLRRVEEWTPSSIGSVAMGHEIGVTSLQLALAGAAIANGGLLLKPRIVLAKQKPGEAEEKVPVEKPQRIIAPETSIKMRQMMEGVVLHGTGTRAVLKGYTSGGKTGSAMIFDLKSHVYTHHYNASFLGFAPVSNPQIVIVVTLEGTASGPSGFGGPVAAPVFREVATSALRMLDVPKDLPEGLLRASQDSPRHPAGSQSVSSVTPPSGQVDSPASAGDIASSHEGSLSQESSGRRLFSGAIAGRETPDFRGMTLRAVLEESSAAGLAVEVQGSGLARDQQPPPGSPLPTYARIRIQFGR
jgi:cell division protein FtsI (penicillin-binding protein 3)